MIHLCKALLNCSRCGSDHENLEFVSFVQPIDLVDAEGDGPYNF